MDSDLMKPAAAACLALSMMRSSCSGKMRGRWRWKGRDAVRTVDEVGWEGTTGRSCGGSPLGDFKLARMKAPRAGGTKMVRCVDGMGSLPRTLTWFQIANWSPAMLSVVPAPARGETARVQAWLRWACQKRGDRRGPGSGGGVYTAWCRSKMPWTIASDKSLSHESRMVWAGTSTGRRPQRPESRCATRWRSKNGT